MYLPPKAQANYMYIAGILSVNKKVGIKCMTVLTCQEHRFEANPGATSEGSQSCQSNCLCKNYSSNWRLHVHI